jgi:hypothetical protein
VSAERARSVRRRRMHLWVYRYAAHRCEYVIDSFQRALSVCQASASAHHVWHEASYYTCMPKRSQLEEDGANSSITKIAQLLCGMKLVWLLCSTSGMKTGKNRSNISLMILLMQCKGYTYCRYIFSMPEGIRELWEYQEA